MPATDPHDGLQDRSEQAIQKCKRCTENTPAVVVRQESLCRCVVLWRGLPFCPSSRYQNPHPRSTTPLTSPPHSECFDKYVRSKCIKRMEPYRVRYPAPAPRHLLLPISFGISSTALLHLLHGQLARQVSQSGRTGFSLLVVHIDESCVDGAPSARSHLDVLRARFPARYVALGIEDIYGFRNAAREVELAAGVDDEKAPGEVGAREALQRLLGALASPTSRTDVLAVLRTRLVVEIAKREGCEGVLWGDTTTRLAEKTLAETAKGRGFAIPWRTADGDSPFGMCAAVGGRAGGRAAE